MQPCPWCVLQRLIYIVVAVLALAGAFMSGRKRQFAIGLALLGTLGGIASALWQHLVTNGCSELFGEIFGDAGKHARSAFGVGQIPMGACVEIELIAELAA